MIATPMNEAEARQVVLVRALETPPGIPQWQEDDRDWASRTAAAEVGEGAATDRFVARRAELAIERLQTRLPAVDRALSGLTWRPWVGPALVVAAFLAGLLVDAVSADRRINILAPPLLTLLAWNLVVFAMLAAAGVADFLRRGRPAPDGDAPAHRPPGLIVRVVSRLAGATVGDRGPETPPPLARFVADWMQASAPLTTARGHACLHAAAAALAAGALTGLYARGLAFQYLAGWDSTFLETASVHALLSLALGPASLLTGIAIPDPGHLESLRFTAGPGENAAPWIHLHAVTIGLFAIAPRVALAAAARWRAGRMSQRFALPLDEPYFRNLDRRHRGVAARVQVVPHSFTLPEEGRRALERLLCRVFGDGTRVAIAAPVALGDEETLDDHWRLDPEATLVVALFTASATPENETHGELLEALGRRVAARVPLAVVIDEQAFQHRFAANPARLESRRAAWRRLVETRTGVAPFVAVLDARTGDEAAAALQRTLDEISTGMGQNGNPTSRGTPAPAGAAAA